MTVRDHFPHFGILKRLELSASMAPPSSLSLSFYSGNIDTETLTYRYNKYYAFIPHPWHYGFVDVFIVVWRGSYPPNATRTGLLERLRRTQSDLVRYPAFLYATLNSQENKRSVIFYTLLREASFVMVLFYSFCLNAYN